MYLPAVCAYVALPMVVSIGLKLFAFDVLRSMLPWCRYHGYRYFVVIAIVVVTFCCIVSAAGLRRMFGELAGTALWLFAFSVALAAITFYFGIVLPHDCRVFCPQCGKFLQDESDWQCGYCDTVNTHSFFEKCIHCKEHPQAYACFHCGHTVILISGGAEAHTARKPGSLMPEMLPTMSPEELRSVRQAEKEAREHEVLLTRLDAELTLEKQRLDLIRETAKAQKKKPATLEEDYATHQGQFVSIREIVARETARAKKKYKNDPEMLERCLESLDAWKSRHI